MMRPQESDGGGWTKAEYDKCSELASRLHRRILDLEDENARLRGMLSGGEMGHAAAAKTTGRATGLVSRRPSPSQGVATSHKCGAWCWQVGGEAACTYLPEQP